MLKSQEFELRKRCNDLNAYCGVRDCILNDGPSRGVRAFELRNGGGMELNVLADRGLDLASLRFRGVNIGLNNKVGVRSPYLYVENGGSGFLKQFFGGQMTTCGITYAGGAGTDEGKELGLHGPLNNLPASQANAWVDYEGDERVLKVSGKMQEAEVFGPDMELSRSLTLHSERNLLRIRDVVTNQGYQTQPVMLIYHINFGYPMLDAGAKVYFSARDVAPRDEIAAQGMSNYFEMEAPECGRDEQCYFHTGWPEDGEAFAMLHNEKLGLAAIVRFDPKVFPLMCQWKCMRAGEYALGLEPTTSGVMNRSDARAQGLLTYLDAGASREYNISIEVTDDADAIARYRALSREG